MMKTDNENPFSMPFHVSEMKFIDGKMLIESSTKFEASS